MKRAFSIMLSVLLLADALAFSFNTQDVKASGAICIRADGSIDPPDASITTSDNVTYTLAGDIPDSIVVERDSIVVDGAGYAIQGSGYGTGILLTGRSNVTVRNVTTNGFDYGIWLNYSSGNIVSGNSMIGNVVGVYLNSSSSNSISGNHMTANYGYGIYLWSSFGNSISGNHVTAGYWYGIYLDSSSGNGISGNNITANGNLAGVWLNNSSDNNSISGNIIASTWDGICIESSGNSISGNNITANAWYGLILWSDCSGNMIYHNNFIGNVNQAGSSGSESVWDHGYPSGGNYWSDYVGEDANKGPGQNETGSDGMGDTPYAIDANNQDYYPLMTPWSEGPTPVHDIAVTNITTCKDECKPFPTVPKYNFIHTNVTIQNLGNFTENFNVTTYADSFMINQTQVSLPTATTVVLTIRWNTTLAYGNYTINAVADTVPTETSTTNNSYNGTKILVTIPGDVDGSLKVGPQDLNTLLAAYGSRPYNPNCDIDDSHKVGPIDLNTLLSHYGQHYP